MAPSLKGENPLVIVDPLPVKTKLATLLPMRPTSKVSTSTSPDKVAVPPTSSSLKVVTPLIAPDAVMSDPVTLFSVKSVKLFEPPVTAPSVMSALLVVVELVSMAVALPRVPHLIPPHHQMSLNFRLALPYYQHWWW